MEIYCNIVRLALKYNPFLHFYSRSIHKVLRRHAEATCIQYKCTEELISLIMTGNFVFYSRQLPIKNKGFRYQVHIYMLPHICFLSLIKVLTCNQLISAIGYMSCVAMLIRF